RRHGVECHLATQESVRVKPSEGDVRVCDRGFSATAAVAHRPGLGASADGPHVKAAAIVDPGDAAATCADFDNLEDGNPDRQALVIPAKKKVWREMGLAASHDASLGRRATHVEGDGSLKLQGVAKGHGPYDSARGTGLHHLNALTAGSRDVL